MAEEIWKLGALGSRELENDILHSGERGMHWGVRRYQNKDGTYTELGKARRRKQERAREKDENVHEDYKRAHDKKSVREMSDVELRNRLNRLNMEKQYTTLAKESTSVSRGRKMLKAAIATVGTTAATINAINTIGKTGNTVLNWMRGPMMEKLNSIIPDLR